MLIIVGVVGDFFSDDWKFGRVFRLCLCCCWIAFLGLL